MSSAPAAAPEFYSGGGGGGGSVPFPFTRRQQPQQDYSFSGRVLLTAVIILAILTVLFVLVRLLLYQLVARAGRGGGGLAAGVRRSFSSRSRRGLDASALAALPVTAYRRYADGGPPGSTSATPAVVASTECAVCLSELADGEKVRALPGCGHVFHVECVDAWLRSRTTCPVCRADVRTWTKGAAGDAGTTSAPPPPALFGAGGTLVVTVQGGASAGGGQPAGAAG